MPCSLCTTADNVPSATFSHLLASGAEENSNGRPFHFTFYSTKGQANTQKEMHITGSCVVTIYRASIQY